jgi:hypothetical protein
LFAERYTSIVNDRNYVPQYPIFSFVFFQSTAPKQYTLKVNAYEHNNHVEQEDEWDVGVI